MVDFRYHALSLVAVFLALGIGIVLGVTVGDSLVSDADRNLRDSLRGDVEEAREQARDQEALGERRDDVIEETAPEVAGGRLRGRRIALIALGELPGGVSDAVEESVELGGGRLARTAVLEPAEGAPGRQVGARTARLVGRGGAGARRLKTEEPRRFTGSFRGPVHAVVVYRHPPPETDPEDEDASRELELREAFEEGLFDGLRDNVVGVEVLDTDPTQSGWYDDHVVPSVDNIDTVAGRLALVLLLANPRREGSFGYKDTADRVIPDLSD